MVGNAHEVGRSAAECRGGREGDVFFFDRHKAMIFEAKLLYETFVEESEAEKGNVS